MPEHWRKRLEIAATILKYFQIKGWRIHEHLRTTYHLSTLKIQLPDCLLGVVAGVVGVNSLVASRVLLEVPEAMEGVLELMYFVVAMHVVEEAFGEEVEIVPGWSFQLGLTRKEGVKLS